MFLRKYQILRNVSTWEELESPNFGFIRNALTIWAIKAMCIVYMNRKRKDPADKDDSLLLEPIDT